MKSNVMVMSMKCRGPAVRRCQRTKSPDASNPVMAKMTSVFLCMKWCTLDVVVIVTSAGTWRPKSGKTLGHRSAV